MKYWVTLDILLESEGPEEINKDTYNMARGLKAISSKISRVIIQATEETDEEN